MEKRENQYLMEKKLLNFNFKELSIKYFKIS